MYVEDDLYAAVYEAADQGLKDAMDLSYLTAQRVADTLKMDERDIRDGTLAIRQGKTLAKRRIEVIGELKLLIDRARSRGRTGTGLPPRDFKSLASTDFAIRAGSRFK